jgi:hypothetical protein
MLKICLPPYDEQGHKYSIAQVIELAKAGKINADTQLENRSGATLEAGSIRGIRFKKIEPDRPPDPVQKYLASLEALPFATLVNRTRTAMLNWLLAGSVILFLQFGLIGLLTYNPILFLVFVVVGLLAAIGSYQICTLCLTLAMEVSLAIDDIRQELKKSNKSNG